MFKLAWSGNRSSKVREEEVRDAPPDRERLRMLIDYFAIGRKIRYSLDYVRRANPGRNGQFVRGNTITPIADTCESVIPSLDTQVDSRMRLKDGPYSDNQMILLRPRTAGNAADEDHYKDGEFSNIKAMDVLEIKTSLLNL